MDRPRNSSTPDCTPRPQPAPRLDWRLLLGAGAIVVMLDVIVDPCP
jgi:hypothetical protein